MQAVFILGFFGTVYAVVLGFTISLSQSVMQQKLERIERVKAIFSDGEYAMINGVLQENPDAESVNCGTDKLKYAQAYVKWRADELQTDPWGIDFKCFSYRLDRTLFADGTGNIAQAPVRVFALISAGPDRQFQTTDSTDFSGATVLEAPTGSDDIVYVFSTFDKMLEMWNVVKSKVDKTKALNLEDYQQKVRAYQPFIEEYYKIYGSALIASGMSSADLARQWAIDLDPSGSVVVTVGGVASNTVYPSMATDLKAAADFKDMPAIVSSALTVTAGANPYLSTLSVVPVGGSKWTITYSVDVNGLEGL